MAGRPKTMYRKVKAIRDELELLRAKLHALMPEQYRVDSFLFINMFPGAIDPDHDLPYNDRGKVWRAAVRGMYEARNEVAVLAAQLNPNPPQPVEDEDGWDDEDDGSSGPEADNEAAGAENGESKASEVMPDAASIGEKPTEPMASEPAILSC